MVKRAFEKAEHTDGNEHFLVGRLRNSEAFVPELSLIAEYEDNVVGHIMFTKIKVGNTTQLTLAPVSVLPEFQGKGIGTKLIEAGHEIAKRMGFEFLILIGHSSYYPRFGYSSAAKFGIQAPFEVPEECFMAMNLQEKKTTLDGVVEYAREFFEQ